jgi:hypothetical protein
LKERVKSHQAEISELKKDNDRYGSRLSVLEIDFYLEKVYLFGAQLHDSVCRDHLFPLIEAEVKELGCEDWKEVKAAMSKEDREDGDVFGVVNRGTCELFGIKEEGEELIARIRSIIANRIDVAHPRGTSAVLARRLERYLEHVESLDLDDCEREDLNFLRILVDYVKKH